MATDHHIEGNDSRPGLTSPTNKGKGRRAQIITAARRLFAENGTEPTSVEDITAAAGVSRTALYYYFPTKADLVQACVAAGDWDWWTGAIEAGQEAATFAERVRILLIECIDRTLATDVGLYFTLLHVAQEDPDVRAGIRSRADDVREAIRAFVDDCKSRSQLSADAATDAVTEALLGLIWSVSAGVAHTRDHTTIAQVRGAIDLLGGELIRGLPDTPGIKQRRGKANR